MASAASGRGQIIQKQDVENWINERRAAGKADPSVSKFLQSKLNEGYGLSGGVLNAANNNRYESRKQTVLRHAGMGDGVFEGSLAGMKGAKLSPGTAYYGSTAITEPAKGSRSVNGGWTSTKERTTHLPIVLPRDMVAGQQQEPTRAPQEAKQPPEPGPDLVAAREAYDRATTYREQSGSAAAGGSYESPLSKSGPELYAAIDEQARGELAGYEKRFADYWDTRANLTAQEIGYAGRQAIASLPDDLNLPAYTSIFPDSGAAGDKIAEKGLYGWLSNQKRMG